MIKILKTLLLFYCLVFSIRLHSQDSIKSKKEIRVLLLKASKYLTEFKTDLSIENAKKALSLSLKKKDNDGIAQSYNFIGLNLVEHNEYEKAIEYYKKSLKYANKTENDTIKSWVNNNLGNLYSYNLKDYEKGIKHYLVSLEFAKKISLIEQNYSKLNIISAYFDFKKFNQGEKFLKEVEVNLDVLKDEPEANFLFYSLNGDLFQHQNKMELAEENYIKALKISKSKPKNFYYYNQIMINDKLSSFYNKLENYKKAYKFLYISDSLKQNYSNQNDIRKIKLLGAQIEYEEIERELIKIENEKKNQEQELTNIKFFILLIFLIFLITLLVLYSQFRINKIRVKANQELKIANEALLIAKENAEETSKLKSQFVSTVSHELRTPLYGVIGMTEIIEIEHKELINSPHLKALKFSAKYLLSLVNDILKVYRFEENQVVLVNNLFNLEDKLEVIKDSMENLAIKHNNKISVNVDDEIPKFIIGDSIRLSQIIINLMSNSLKFTRNGEIELSAKLNKIINKLFYIEFKVRDTGIGIPEKFQNKVFDKFVQINRKEDDYQGTGLGLTIVKKLIEIFKGEIKLESKENEGTTFTFTIPFESGEDKVTEFVNNIKVDLSESRTYRILIVEDNKINQIVTKRLLENYKFICEIADDGYMAIELLEKNNFDAILMDINMPKINGFETTKLIRQKKYNLPIIAVTAFEKEEVEEKAKNAGIDDIISKPFDAKQLFQMIHQHVSFKKY